MAREREHYKHLEPDVWAGWVVVALLVLSPLGLWKMWELVCAFYVWMYR